MDDDGQKYPMIKSAPDVVVAGFDSYFQIDTEDLGTASKQALDIVARINREMRNAGSADLPKNDARRAAAIEIRNSYAEALKAIAKSLVDIKDTLDDSRYGDFRDYLGKAFGEFDVRWSRIKIRSDYATLVPNSENARTIYFDQPLDITEAQSNLINDLNWANTVINLIVERRVTGRFLRKFGKRWLGGRPSDDDNRLPEKLQRIQSGYLNELKDIADLGLESAGQITAAERKLLAFKSGFVVREAGFVKNQYVASLATWAITFVIILAAMRYAVSIYYTRLGLDDASNVFMQKLLLAACATSVGTWLSFSLRRVSLTFDDLATLEDDRLAPPWRLAFTMLLASALGIFISAQFVQFSIGSTKLSIDESAIKTVAFGLLCGISERSLSGAVSRQTATAFDKGVTIPSQTGETGK